MQATAATKRTSSENVSIQLLRMQRLNCLDESTHPIEQGFPEQLTNG